MKKFLMVLLSIAFVLNLAIVIGLIGGYGSPRRALYTITDDEQCLSLQKRLAI